MQTNPLKSCNRKLGQSGYHKNHASMKVIINFFIKEVHFNSNVVENWGFQHTITLDYHEFCLVISQAADIPFFLSRLEFLDPVTMGLSDFNPI